MALLDIFNDDAFSVTELTDVINDIPRVPTLLGDLKIFDEYGIYGTTAMIERTGSSISLVPTTERGGVRDPGRSQNRIIIPAKTAHIPQGRTILADEVLGVRRFGTEGDRESIQDLIRGKMESMRANQDLTLEHMRVGVLKGQVVDADGTSVLWDMYDMMGQTQQTVFFNMVTPTTNIDLLLLTEQIKRKMRAALGGRSFSGVRCIVSIGFFDKLVGHDDMKERWALWQDGAFGRDYPTTTNFKFNGVTFTVYEGGTDAGDFIPDGFGYAYPEGVPKLFRTAFAPGDYVDVVGTLGVPFYAKQERMPFDKGVMLEAQSNPLFYCTLPEAVIKLSAAAS